MKNKSTILTAAAILAAALVVGLAIRHFRASRATLKAQALQQQQAQTAPEKLETAPEPEPEDVNMTFAQQVAYGQQSPANTQPAAPAAPPTAPVTQPQRNPWQFGQNADLIRQFFADLNLNEEEMARLQQGFMAMRMAFESLTPEQQMAEFERMQQMGERWENMTEEERSGVYDRMKGRYEEWRNSDSIDIPMLTFD